MPRPLRIDSPGAIHHVIARGNERKPVFRDDEDRHAFLATVDRCHARLRFDVLAYCLMTNHVHLAIRTGPQPLARIALSVLSAYAGRFNRRHRRVGHLFQGRYRAHRVFDDRYLLAVIRYIHRNPVIAGMVGKAEKYPWSSDRLYRRRSPSPPAWIDRDTILSALSADPDEAFLRYRQLIDVEPEPFEYSMEPAEASGAYAPSRPREMSDIAKIASAVSAATGEPLSRLHSSTKERSASRARALTAILARDVGRIALSRTADYFRRDESVICRSVAKVESRLTEDVEAANILERLRSLLREENGTVDP